MLLLRKLKMAARDVLPDRFQVPIRHRYSQIRGHREPEMALLPMLVSKGAHVADVGGNRGAYAYRLWRLGASVEVFEPNPVCLRVLQSWSQSVSRVKVHPVALSADAGSATLHVPVDPSGVEHDASASIGLPVDGQHHHLEVSLRTLDSFAFDDLSFIKIDVEGHESDVIAGATETIRRSMPSLLVEIEQRHLQDRPIESVFDQILDLGYRGCFLLDGVEMPLSQFDLGTHQPIEAFGTPGARYVNNFLFLPEGRSNGVHETLIKAPHSPRASSARHS